jgi:hypothetical protein
MHREKREDLPLDQGQWYCNDSQEKLKALKVPSKNTIKLNILWTSTIYYLRSPVGISNPFLPFPFSQVTVKALNQPLSVATRP